MEQNSISRANCTFWATLLFFILLWGTVGGTSWSVRDAHAGKYVFTPIEIPKAHNSYAHDINNSGLIVGFYDFFDAVGFIKDINDGITNIVYPMSPYSNVRGISNSGLIVGSAKGINDAVIGYKKDMNKNYSVIDILGSSYVMPYDINDKGDIVGIFKDQDISHGFIKYSNGSYNIIDYPGAKETWVSGINDKGDIVGTYLNNGSLNGRAFYATPVPIPSAFWLFCFAIMGLAGIRTKFRKK